MSEICFTNYVGKVVEKLRLDLGWTQVDLSKKSDVSNVVISRLESGANFEIHTLKKLALALGRHPYEIIWMAQCLADESTSDEAA